MDIVGRLKDFMDYKGLASSQFADTAQIPRPTLSQIMSGRNKKISNEVITKLHDAFPELNVMWLLFGDGQMVNTQQNENSEAQNMPNLFESTDLAPYGQSVSGDNDLFDITPRSEPKNYPPMPRRRPQPETAQKTPSDSHNTYINGGDHNAYNNRHRTAGTTNAAGAPPHQNGDSRTTIVDFSDTTFPPSQQSYRSVDPQPLTSATPINGTEQQPTTAQQQREQTTQTNIAGLAANLADKTKHIDSIMVFYSDKSFDTFYPSTPHN